MTSQSPNIQPRPSALSKLFAAKKSKVNTNKCVTELLCVFAEQDHKRIARLLAKWLEADLVNKQPAMIKSKK
ncbi:MAG: hypothetical protein ACI9C4_000035 [Paraglaciecola sp.]|jgi:hypothetical protein